MNKKLIAVISVIPVVIALIIIAVLLSKNNNTLESKIKSGAVEQDITEDVSYKAEEGNYSVKIVNVYETEPDTDKTSPPEAERVVVVVYEYTNSDMESGLVISDSHFKAFDKDGNELEVYPQKNLFEPGEIGAEGTHTASVAYAFNNAENYIEIDYYNDISSETPDSVFTKEF